MSINRIAIISLPVRDQHVAKAFYENELGFVVTRDDPFQGENARWIELAPEGAQTSLTLVTWFDWMPPGSIHGVVLDTDDVRAAHASLQAKGVKTSEVQSAPWGSFFTFNDPDGNGLVIQQNG